jgi:hypothetical protein
MTSNPKVQRGNALRSTGPKTQSGSKRPKLRRGADKPTKKKPVIVNAPSNGADTPSGRLKNIGGSVSDAFNGIVLNQALRSVFVLNSDKNNRDAHIQAVMVAMIAVKPKDELEGMLAAQMVAIHNVTMECLRRAIRPEQPFDEWRENLNQANKLTHSYATLIEALDRHRGKGQQHVTVEHVHVNQGGQAIVGAVTPRGGGGIPTI